MSPDDAQPLVMPSIEHLHSFHDGGEGDVDAPSPLPTPPPPSTLIERHVSASTTAAALAAARAAEYADIDGEQALVELNFENDAAEFLRAVDEADAPVRAPPRRARHSAEEELRLVDVTGDSAAEPAPSDSTDSADDAAATAASASSRRSAALTLATAWAALLIAVFSMSAVGPMFLYMQKRGIAPLRAVFWRQTVQIFFLIPPAILEFRRAPLAERAWWRKRVQFDSDEEQQDKMEQQQEQQATAAPSHKRKKGYETVANDTSTHSAAAAAADASTPTPMTRTGDDSGSTYVDVASGAGMPSDSAPDVDASLEEGTAAAAAGGVAALPTQSSKSRSPLLSLLIIAGCWSFSVSLWVVALPYTSAARSSLFSSLYPLFIIIYLRLFRKVPVSIGEFAGVIVCIVGIVVSEVMASLAPDENTMAAQAARARHEAEAAAAAAAAGAGAWNGTDASGGNSTGLFPSDSSLADGPNVAHLQLIGDLLCILSSLFIGFNVVESSPTRKVVPLFSFTVLTSCIMWLWLLFATVAFEGTNFSGHEVVGLWGWTASTEMVLRMLLFGFLVGMVGILGFNYSVSHMSPIVFSTVQLLDPGISGVMSALFGVEGWPTGSTYIGVAVVTLGIFLVVVYQTKREAAVEEARKRRKNKTVQFEAALISNGGASSFSSPRLTLSGDATPPSFDAALPPHSGATPPSISASTTNTPVAANDPFVARQRRGRAPSAYERVEMQEMQDDDANVHFNHE